MALEEITAVVWVVIRAVVAGKNLQHPASWGAASFAEGSGINCFTFSCSQSLSKLPAGTLLEPCV